MAPRPLAAAAVEVLLIEAPEWGGHTTHRSSSNLVILFLARLSCMVQQGVMSTVDSVASGAETSPRQETLDELKLDCMSLIPAAMLVTKQRDII